MFQTTEQMKKRARNLKKNFLNVYYEIMEHASALSEEIILELFSMKPSKKKKITKQNEDFKSVVIS
jgi:hypothetical protein